MKFRVAALVLALAAAASCSSAKQYEMRGQILAINRDKMEILVKHEEISGLMPAMTMPWKVESLNLVDNLGAGDLITSQIRVEDSQGVVTSITKLGTARPDLPAPAAPARPGVKFIAPGDPVPNQTLIDQEGRTRDFAAIRGGRAIAVTFIYTKCPVPTFCPAMDRQFVELQSLIKKNGLEKTAGLLSVSFDPKNDTPAVMKQHAEKLGYDPGVWTFVTSDRDSIDRFAESFGVTLVRGQGATPDEIGHTLRMAVVDRHGNLVKHFSGGEWTTADLMRELKQ
jgi:protein SCO1/2